MNYFVLSLGLTIAICLFICINTFRKRKEKGFMAIFWIMAGIAWWSFCYILEIVTKSFEAKFFWYRMEYIAISTIPLLWLIFSLEYAGLDRQYIKKRIWPLLSIPLATMFLVWTNSAHNLFIRDVALSLDGPVSVIIKSNAMGYWFSVSMAYLFMSAGTFILIRSVFYLPSVYGKQGLIFIIGAFIPLIVNIIYLLEINPFAPFDMTPTAFSFSGLILVWGLLGLKSFSLVPLARDKVFHYIDNGVLIVDANHRIADLNKTMQEILESEPQDLIGHDVFAFFHSAQININRKDFQERSKKEILIHHGSKKYYTVSIIKMVKETEPPSGYILVFRDVTKSKKAAKAISDYNRKIIKLNNASRELSGCRTRDEVFRKTAEHAHRIIGFEHCSFFKIHHPDLRNHYHSSAAIKNFAAEKDFLKELADSASQKESAAFFEAECCEVRYHILRILLGESFLAVFYSEDKKIFTKENISVCQLLLEHSLEALRNMDFLKKLHEAAEKDSLTGAYNRRYFNKIIPKEISRAKRYDYPITFVMADVDRFKEINDRFGHQAGDEVLKEVARKIHAKIRKEDTLIRYGGDEFLIVLPHADISNIGYFIDRIKRSVDGIPISEKRIDFTTSLSTGIAIWEPSDKRGIEETLHIADAKMYESKKIKRSSPLDSFDD